jgi:hypothetical protein
LFYSCFTYVLTTSTVTNYDTQYILILKGCQKGFWLNWYNLLISRVTPFSIYFMDSNNDMNNIACFTSIAISLLNIWYWNTNQIKHVCLLQGGHHHHFIECNLFLKWHNLKNCSFWCITTIGYFCQITLITT